MCKLEWCQKRLTVSIQTSMNVQVTTECLNYRYLRNVFVAVITVFDFYAKVLLKDIIHNLGIKVLWTLS